VTYDMNLGEIDRQFMSGMVIWACCSDYKPRRHRRAIEYVENAVSLA
jgi:hypothetical protein